MAAGSGYETGAAGGFEAISTAAPKRYGPAAGFTATTGGVDKTGYIDREARRRARQQRISSMITPTQTTPAVPSSVLRGMGQWH
jgi:hypothetical protein